MAEGVYTRNKRFSFVEKLISEVGEGTLYPMKVTMTQLAEIMYRVNDAKWVSGEASQAYANGGGTLTFTTKFTSATPSSERVIWEYLADDGFGNFNAGAYSRRGYVAIDQLDSPNQPLETYPDSWFSEVKYVITGGFDFSGEASVSQAYREAIRELSIWVSPIPAFENLGQDMISPDADTFKTGFSVAAITLFPSIDTSSLEVPTIYTSYSTISDGVNEGNAAAGLVQLAFNGEVAWVDTNNSGSIIDPDNELYIGLTFRIINARETSGTYDFSTLLSDLSTPSSELSLLKLKLSGVNQYVTAKIYGDEVDDPRFFALGAGTCSSTDWIFEATEWWPYQDGDGNVWSTTTGLPA